MATPLRGDRAAHDATNYPELHSSDLDGNTPIYHTPLPGTVGNVLISDGTKWISQSLTGSSPALVTLGSKEGDLVVAESPLKIYNLYGNDRNITKVFLAVTTASTGDDIIVDVKINGLSIFLSQVTMPAILAGEYTGESIVIESPTWGSETPLSWEIVQIGSGDPGSNLMVHIVHDNNVILGSGS